MNSIKPIIDPSWETVLNEEFQKPYFSDIKKVLVQAIVDKKTIYPEPQNIFQAFNLCPFDKVKVIILGQDPYHGPQQAHGLSFSVLPGTKVPPSLQNIYKELHTDLGVEIPQNGYLEPWAKQGVLLLNASLTVEAHRPNSHSKIGWHNFTDSVIQHLSEEKTGLIFLLWGNFARAKKDLIDPTKHIILEAPHPSPFSAHSGFFGCQHFSKTNQQLEKQEQTPIKW